MGARPHRSIKLRRTRDTGGTTAEYLRLLITVLVLFALQATMAETPFAVFVQLLVAGSALILALRVADAPERVRRYIGLLVVVALGGALVQIVQGHSSLAPTGAT